MNILCPTCGTDQETSGETTQRCVVCGKELTADAGVAPVSTEIDGGHGAATPSAGPTTEPEAAKLVAALPTRAIGASSVDFEELRSGARVSEWLAAMIPLYGLARLSQTTLLSFSQKAVAATVSVGLTIALGTGLWAVRGSGQKVVEFPADEVDGQIVALRDLILQFADQTGNLPSAEEWSRSVETVDSRLVDPWGQPYVYERIDGGFRIGSLGRDRAVGGEGENADKFEAFEGARS